MTVVEFPGTTTVHEPAEKLLEKAKDWGLHDALVLGQADGQFMFGGNMGDSAEILWLLELAKKQILDNVR